MNQYIRKVAPDGSVSTLADSYGQPAGIAATPAGVVYFSVAHRIQRIALDGTVSVLAGNYDQSGHVDAVGSAARFSSPAGLAVDASGNLHVADRDNHRIRKITPTGTVSTLAGEGTAGQLDGVGEIARFDAPIALAASASGELFAGESTQSTLRRVAPTRVVVQVTTGPTGTDDLPVALALADLAPGATYYFRAFATNGGGTTVGNVMSFGGTPGGSPFQAWQTAEFAADATNESIAGALANPSHDGVPNLHKYAFDLDPHVASTAGLPTAGIAGDSLTLIYTKVLAATDLVYTPEWSTDLVTWSTAGITESILILPGPQPSGPQPANPLFTRQIRASVLIGTDKAKFIRLNVTLQQP